MARRIRVGARAIASRLTVGNRTRLLNVIRLLDLKTRHEFVVADDFLFAHDVVALLDFELGHHFDAFGRVACGHWFAVCFAAAALTTT